MLQCFALAQNQRQAVFSQISHPSSPTFYASFNTPLNSKPGLQLSASPLKSSPLCSFSPSLLHFHTQATFTCFIQYSPVTSPVPQRLASPAPHLWASETQKALSGRGLSTETSEPRSYRSIPQSHVLNEAGRNKPQCDTLCSWLMGSRKGKNHQSSMQQPKEKQRNHPSVPVLNDRLVTTLLLLSVPPPLQTHRRKPDSTGEHSRQTEPICSQSAILPLLDNCYGPTVLIPLRSLLKVEQKFSASTRTFS